jgi:phosphatidylethanolamine/phosphatidyl-N-methylethanolamine N-methyltransferase
VKADRSKARSYWDRMAPRYDLAMAILGGPLPQAAKLARETVTGLEVLEVGAGTGLFTDELASSARRVLATDYSESMVEQLRRRVATRGNVECAVLDLADPMTMESHRSRYDAVVAANVLHLVEDLTLALGNLAACLRPGGKLVAPTYCHDETFGARWISRGLALSGFPGERRFSVSSLARVLEEAGFRVVRAERVPGILPIGFLEVHRA